MTALAQLYVLRSDRARSLKKQRALYPNFIIIVLIQIDTAASHDIVRLNHTNQSMTQTVPTARAFHHSVNIRNGLQ